MSDNGKKSASAYQWLSRSCKKRKKGDHKVRRKNISFKDWNIAWKGSSEQQDIFLKD